MGAVLLPLAGAAVFLSLSRWGRRNAAELVPATLSAERRQREERKIRRGARSLLLFAVLLTLMAVVQVVAQVRGSG